MEFFETYKKLSEGSNVTLSECIEFVKHVASVYNPSVPYKEEYTVAAFQGGFGSIIIQTCLNVVEHYPDLFKVQTSRLYSKEGMLLTTYFHKL